MSGRGGGGRGRIGLNTKNELEGKRHSVEKTNAAAINPPHSVDYPRELERIFCPNWQPIFWPGGLNLCRRQLSFTIKLFFVILNKLGKDL